MLINVHLIALYLGIDFNFEGWFPEFYEPILDLLPELSIDESESVSYCPTF
jgi:hypothetical protein